MRAPPVPKPTTSILPVMHPWESPSARKTTGGACWSSSRATIRDAAFDSSAEGQGTRLQQDGVFRSGVADIKRAYMHRRKMH